MTVPATGLAVHYETDAITGLMNGDKIDQWNDLSGNAYHATGTGTSRPEYRTNVSKGQPSLYFDGVNDFLTIGNVFSISNNVTIFVAFRPSDSNVRRTIFGQENAPVAVNLEYGADTNSGQLSIWPNRGTVIPGVYASYASCGGTTSVLANLAAAAGRTETLVYKRDGTGNTHAIRVNRYDRNLPTAGTSSASGNGTKIIGRRASGSQYLKGDLFALLIYTRTLTTAEIEEVEEHLASKYYEPDETEFVNRSSNNLGTDNAQGIAFDGTYYYFVTTQGLQKLTRVADVYTTVVARDVRAEYPSSTGQINGEDIHGGYLWTGCSNYPVEPKRSWICKYDPSDLSQVAYYPIQAGHTEGGAWKDVGNGPEYWAGYNDQDIIVRYDATFSKIAEYALPLARGLALGYQNVMWMGNYLITPVHPDNAPNNPIDVYLWTGSGFTTVGSYLPPTGRSTQGMAWEGTPANGGMMIYAERLIAGSDSRIVRAKWNALSITTDSPIYSGVNMLVGIG